MSHSKTESIPLGWTAENGMHVIQTSPAILADAERIVDRALASLVSHDRLVVELFAGPGGMSEALKYAGIPERTILGLEWDSSACMTATAAGHPRWHVDLTLVDPRWLGKVWGLHASPSCQGFSMAGKGESRGDTDLLLMAIKAMGREPDRADEILAKFRELAKSPLSSLSLEPLRYILALRPEWFTLEQVRAVLPLWEAYAAVLRPLGYSVWTGVESAEKFGVPQTRVRALAMGSLVRDLSGGLRQTHSRFFTSRAKRGQLEPGFLPYVTMAQALSVTSDWIMRSNYGTGGDPEARGERTGAEPAATVTSKVGRNKFVVADGEIPPVYVNGNQPNAGRRSANEPAPTIHFGARINEVKWATHMGDVRQAHGAVRAVDEPAATITSAMDNGNFQWIADGGVTARVTAQEAGALQSFPADYPWHGNISKQYEQVGNAVPPLLGQALAEHAIGKRTT